MRQTTQEQDFVTFLKESNLTAAQIAGIPKADVVVKWTYEIGKTLVPPEVVSVLPTQMYKLHQHYMRAMANYSIRRPSTSLWSACGFCKYFTLLTYCFA